jgi:tetratricopeptide (TPR) repeat protein
MATDLPDIDSLWNYADNAGSEARFREALKLAEAAGDDVYLAEMLTQLARAEGREGKFDDARSTLDRAEKLIQPEMTRARVRLLLERGRVFNSSGEPVRALPFFTDAFELAKTSQLSRLAVDAIHMIAIADRDPTAQIEWNLKGVALAEELKERGWLSALYNNLGEAYAADNDFKNALDTFRKLVALEVEKGKEPDVFAQKDVAKMLRLLGRYDEAVKMLEPIETTLASKGEPNGYIDEEIAECLFATARRDEAIPYFARAYKLQSTDEWVVKHEAERLNRLRRLSTARGENLNP